MTMEMSTGVVPFGRPPEKKDSAAAKVVYMQYMGQPAWMPRDYTAFAKEGYTENAIVYRCIRLIAEAIKAIPLEVHKDGQPVEKHKFLDLIRMPNPFTTESDLVDAMVSFLMIAGNSYVEYAKQGSVEELYVLRADRMKITVNQRGYPSRYTYSVGMSETNFDIPNPGKQMSIMHLRTFNPLNDFFGMSPMDPAAKAIDTHNAAGAYNAALLQNMGRPSGALMVEGDDQQNVLTDEQFSRLKSQITEQMSGSQAAGKPLLLEGGLKWVPFSQNAQDMEFQEGKNSAARDISQSFGVPPQMLGIPGDNTYANLKEANLAFYRQTIIPLMTKLCQAWTVFMRPTYGEDFVVWFNMDQVTGLSAEREERWKTANEATFVTVNEKREMVGLEEREEGDVILVSTSMVPLDEDLGDVNETALPGDGTETEEDADELGNEEAEDGEEKPGGPKGGGSDKVKQPKASGEDE